MTHRKYRSLQYSVLDVFAERPLEGNPLAVFHDARGLATVEMQALARETNLSETTFVFPSDDPEEDRRDGVRVRIFTTTEELPFAGHPTLGTASWLHGNYAPLRGAETVKLRLAVGSVPVQFTQQSPESDGVFGVMQQPPPVFGDVHDASEVARVLGLQEENLLPGYAPATVSTGNPFCIVVLRSLEALRRLAIPQAVAVPWLRARGIRWFYVIARDTQDGQPDCWQARMQWQSGEDPATGSAAGPCVAFLVRSGLLSAEHRVTLLQGLEVHRPSRLTAWVRLSNEGAMDIFVAGRTIPVAGGAFVLPL